MAWATWSSPTSREASASGLSWMRTAYFCEPKTMTWATPLTMEIRWAIMVSAYSSRVERGRVGEVRTIKRIGVRAGLTFW